MSTFLNAKSKLQAAGLVSADPKHGDLINPFACSGCGSNVSESRLVRNRVSGELVPKENGKVAFHLSIPFATPEEKKKAGARKNVEVYNNVCLECVYGEAVTDSEGRWKKISFTNSKGETKTRVLRVWEAMLSEFKDVEEAGTWSLMARKQFLWEELNAKIAKAKTLREEREAGREQAQADRAKAFAAEKKKASKARRKGLGNLIATAKAVKEKAAENGASKQDKAKTAKSKKKAEDASLMATMNALAAERKGK